MVNWTRTSAYLPGAHCLSLFSLLQPGKASWASGTGSWAAENGPGTPEYLATAHRRRVPGALGRVRSLRAPLPRGCAARLARGAAPQRTLRRCDLPRAHAAILPPLVHSQNGLPAPQRSPPKPWLRPRGRGWSSGSPFGPGRRVRVWKPCSEGLPRPDLPRAPGDSVGLGLEVRAGPPRESLL